MSSSTPTPTQSIGHLKHINPTAGPTELSKTHPNIVNYAISAGGVLLGIAFIGAFVLFRRCNRRRKQDALDVQIDARIHENDRVVSRMTMAASRTQSLAKLPNAALMRDQSAVHPMPLLTAGNSASASTNSSTSTLPCTQVTCVRGSDLRLSCGCGDCLALVRVSVATGALRSSSSSPGSSAHASSTLGSGSGPQAAVGHPTMRYLSLPFTNTRTTRTLGLPTFVRSSSSSRAGTTLGRNNGPSRQTSQTGPDTTPRGHLSTSARGQIQNDENAHRDASIRVRTPTENNTFGWDTVGMPSFGLTSSGPLSWTHGVGIGIMTATSTGALGCPSPATPSLVFSTPGTTGSAFGSPALSLSDDAGATILSPRSPPHLSLGSMGTLGSLGAGGSFTRSGTGSSVGTSGRKNPFSPLSGTVSAAYLGNDLAHMHVSPHMAGSESEGIFAAGSTPVSPQLAVRDCATDVGPSSSFKAATMQPVRGKGEKWFTDVDWFAEDGPLALASYEQPEAHLSVTDGAYATCGAEAC
ncbi:hypothetical protein BV20DRAFT_967205 [Pilatotrama ljubarskyi]|nr:hypothetical protein BV20DRAFT_967205 [Pilatotrama ljubarskyi]